MAEEVKTNELKPETSPAQKADVLADKAAKLRAELGIVLPETKSEKKDEKKDEKKEEQSKNIESEKKKENQEPAKKEENKGNEEISLLKEQIRKLEEKLDSKPEKEKASDLKNDVYNELVEAEIEALKQLKKVEKEISKASMDDDDAKLEELIKERSKLQLQVADIESEAKRLKKDEEIKDNENKAKSNYSKFESSFQEAFKDFPELIKGDKPNYDHPVMKETMKLLKENANKPSFLTTLSMINPRYDHANGAYMAVLQAYKNLSNTIKPEEVEKLKSEKDKLKKEKEHLNNITQPLAGGVAGGSILDGQESEDGKIERLRSKMEESNFDEKDVANYKTAVMRKGRKAA
jgi:myosin heavy subunit